MAKTNASLFAFNRGLVSSTALARVDLERMRLSAEEQTNWIPRALGSMSLRPGLRYVNTIAGAEISKTLPFIYSTTQTALLEFTSETLTPIIDEAPIERASVSTAIANGDFSGGSSSWTLTTGGKGDASFSGGKLTFQCYAVDSWATVTQTLTIAGGDQNIEHALRIVVLNGDVVFKAGTASNTDDLISVTSLGTGTHSLAFTPTTGSVYIQFECRERRPVAVDSCEIEAAGTVTLPGFWFNDDLPYLRYTQSGDVVFIACYGHQPRKIERRATRSWSLVLYEPADGPFGGATPDSTIKLSIDKGYGAATVTASRPFFKSTNVGSLLRIFTPGYNLPFDVGQNDAYTPAVRVNGVGTARAVSIVTTGTWVGTLTIQKSYIGEDAGFVDTGTTITTNTTTAFTDTADNTAVWIRIGFKAGYTSGTAIIQTIFGDGSSSGATAATSQGGRFGIVRITAYSSADTVQGDVLSPPSSSAASNTWFESEWSDRRGWPSAVDLHEGRLFWGGGDKIWGSISDAYSSFDPSQSGDSGPIQRSIGRGPVQIINWLLPLSRLVIGTEASEITLRSSSFDEPITPTNFTLKDVSTFGTARLPACKIDARGVFMDVTAQQLMDIAYAVEAQDYSTTEMLQLVPKLNLNNSVVAIAVQRRPDTRIHMVREDGTVAIFLFDPKQDIRCPIIFDCTGSVEDVTIIPGAVEEKVYYTIARTIDGNTIRTRECWAREDECVGGTLNKQADSFITYSGAATTTITGLDHLEGESVVVWAAGKDLGSYTVSSGQITGLSESVTSAIVGLTYRARFKSTKLAYAAQGGTAINQRKRINAIGLLLSQTHYQGLEHGDTFNRMDNLPLVIDGADVAANTIHEALDLDMTSTPGNWSTDSRLCLEANAPRPCTVMGVVIQMETNG